MTQRRHLAALTALILCCAGCSQAGGDNHDHLDDLGATSSMSTTVPNFTYPPSLGVDATDPDDVAIGAVRAMYGWRFATDDDPRDAVTRARPLLNAALATSLTNVPPEPFINFKIWDAWKRSGARTSVRVAISPERHPADTDHQQKRKVTTRISVTDRNAKVLHQWEFAVLVVIQRQAGQWVVAQFRPLGL